MFLFPDGSKAFVQAIIDNLSRYVLAWSIEKTQNAKISRQTIQRALKEAHRLGKLNVPNIYVDDGSENNNKVVNRLIDQNKITRTIAQIEVNFSNSMIEAFFKSMKYYHLYSQSIHTVKDLSRHIRFFIDQHNNHVPLWSLKGAKPIEIFTGSWGSEEKERLKMEMAEARAKRHRFNAEIQCKQSSAKFSPP